MIFDGCCLIVHLSCRADGDHDYLLFLSGLRLRDCFGLAVDAALALDTAELPAQFPVFVGGDIVEVLADNPGIPTQEVDAVPVGSVDSHLLHQLESGAPLFAKLVFLAGLAFEVLAAFVIFCPGHLAQTVGAPVGVLVNDALFDIVPVAYRIERPDGGIEPSEVSYLLLHLIYKFFEPVQLLRNPDISQATS